MSNPVIDQYGNQYWYNFNHKLHRTDGPAFIGSDGRHEWYLNGKWHRENGPALVGADGSQHWYINGQLHRIDGPAYIRIDGSQAWLVNGMRALSNKEFQELANIIDEEMTLIILKYGNVK